MFAEFIREFERLARAGQAPQVVQLPGMPKHQVLARDAEGKIQVVNLDESPRDHVTSDLESICKLCAENCGSVGDDDLKPTTNRPELWFSRNGVELVINAPGNRRDTASFGLNFSPQILELFRFEQQKPKLKQKDLIRTLRVLFKKCLNGDFLDLVRRIQMVTNLTSEEQQTRRNLGKAAEATLGGGREVPNELVFDVPVFAQGTLAHVTETVECVLELDLDGNEPMFAIIPVAGGIEAAITRAEKAVGVELQKIMTQDHAKETPQDYGLYQGDHVEAAK